MSTTIAVPMLALIACNASVASPNSCSCYAPSAAHSLRRESAQALNTLLEVAGLVDSMI